jgi:two-component system response regulator AtoC
VRELSNLMERAVLFCPGSTLESMHFPSDIQGLPMQPVPDTHSALSSSPEVIDPSQISLAFRLGDSLSELEDRIISEVLQRSDGNKTLAAKHLGITRWKLDRRRKTDS